MKLHNILRNSITLQAIKQQNLIHFFTGMSEAIFKLMSYSVIRFQKHAVTNP